MHKSDLPCLVPQVGARTAEKNTPSMALVRLIDGKGTRWEQGLVTFSMWDMGVG